MRSLRELRLLFHGRSFAWSLETEFSSEEKCGLEIIFALETFQGNKAFFFW